MHTLLIRLEGPLQSWGISSRFSERDTTMEPSKSGVIGLLCAALGKPRGEDEGSLQQWPSLSTLAGLRMGARCDRTGIVGIDFQTAGGGRMAGRRYGVPRSNGGIAPCVISHRYFLQDASFLVGLSGEDEAILHRLHRALQSPVWQIFLGRKGYVPAVPPYLADGLVPHDLLPALSRYPLADRADPDVRVVIEDVYPLATEPRMDQPTDYAHRRFGRRYVRVEHLAALGARLGGDGHVPHADAP